MLRLQCALLCALLASSILTPVHTKRFSGRGGGSHSYPHSGGLSGGSHSYPKSSGGSHGYPSSGGLSGTGSHGYPSSGGLSGSGSHGYPSSGGLSGSGSKPGSGYPNTNTHHSNSHGYPAGSGLAGNTHGSGGSHTTVNNHYHYNYSPPQQIRYQPTHGAAVNYPVYHGTPPTYVYQYQNSGSKYSSLLAGLALFNLGALAGTVYGHHSHSTYKPKPGEVCKFGVRKDNGDYEETRIDCQLITSFIFQSEAAQNHPTNATSVTTTVTNTTTTIMNNTNDSPAPAPVAADVTPNLTMLPNGTLVPSNETAIAANVTTANETDAKPAEANNTMASSVVVTSTTTNTTVTNAVDVKGPPVDVTPGMKCYIIRNSPSSNMKKSVPCGLLQTYAQQSLKRSSALRIAPLYSLLSVAFVVIALY